MYQVIFHIKMALNYLKRDKKVPEKYKAKLYNLLTEALKDAEKQKEEWK